MRLAAVILLASALSGTGAKPLQTIRYRDGGVAFQLFVLSDGGAEAVRPDGGREPVRVRRGSADAGLNDDEY